MSFSDPTSQNVQQTKVAPAIGIEYPPGDPRGYMLDGVATQGMGRSDGGQFNCPLITKFSDKVWQGGCMHGFELPSEIEYVVSLYPWEKYQISDDQTRTEFRMFDGPVERNTGIQEASRLIEQLISAGVGVLVHCQAGLNRSALTLGLALINLDWNPQDAVDELRNRRSPMVLCNESFERYLLEQDA